jgi:hypothetical protein
MSGNPRRDTPRRGSRSSAPFPRWAAGVVAAALCLPMAMIGLASAQGDQPSLDDLLDLSPTPTRPPADGGQGAAPDDATGDAADPSTRPVSPDLIEEVDRLVRQAPASDILESALKQMDEVSIRLGRSLDPSVATQREQESILAKLDQVIAAARQQQQQQQQSGGGSGQSGPSRQQDSGGQDVAGQQDMGEGGEAGQQGQASASASGDGGQAPPGPSPEAEQGRAIDELRSEWGNLPPRLRDELTEGLSEPFSPVYRELTEAYYRRLAEEE